MAEKGGASPQPSSSYEGDEDIDCSLPAGSAASFKHMAEQLARLSLKVFLLEPRRLPLPL